jgi:hypothetical protein
MKTANMTREEIKELASRYVAVESADFPMDNDLFYFLVRKTSANKVLKDDEGWQFSGYGQCSGYLIDEEGKPLGKWIFMYYKDLSRFPLHEQVLKLQPPHITNGNFFSPDRTLEFRIVKCRVEHQQESNMPDAGKQAGNIIQFPGREPGTNTIK